MIAQSVSRRYFAGIALMPKRKDAVNAGHNVCVLNSLSEEKSVENIITRTNIDRERIRDCIDTVSWRNSEAKMKVKTGASDNIGTAILACVFSKVLK